MEEGNFQDNIFANYGFVLGLASIFFGFTVIVPILAIVFSVIGLHRAVKKRKKGKMLAIAGLLLGIIYLEGYIYRSYFL